MPERVLTVLQMGWWGDMGGPKQRGVVAYSASSSAFWGEVPIADGASFHAHLLTIRYRFGTRWLCHPCQFFMNPTPCVTTLVTGTCQITDAATLFLVRLAHTSPSDNPVPRLPSF
jgi:hypothetical protein